MSGFRQVLVRGIPVHGYRVLADGRIWSEKTKRFLVPYGTGRRGYLAVALRHDGKTIRALVHHLVAEAFIGPRPVGFDVCHNDGVLLHNQASNLRYATRSENLADREAHGTSQRGERNPAAKLTNSQAEELRRRRARGEHLRPLALHFGITESAVSRIFCGTRRSSPCS